MNFWILTVGAFLGLVFLAEPAQSSDGFDFEIGFAISTTLAIIFLISTIIAIKCCLDAVS